MKEVDVLVVGGGHAGIEAASAAARMGCRTLLVTHALDKIGELSCNPAVGGIGKGQLVKEVDALGGLMGELADAAAIQFRLLNTTRGWAVRSSRMQVDRERYPRLAQARLAATVNLTCLGDEVEDLSVTHGVVTGVRLRRHGPVTCAHVVLTPGTFFHGLMHQGETQTPGGRLGDPASTALPERLQQLGFVFRRFKTGTPPRLDRKSIHYDRLVEQPGDDEFLPFSQRSPRGPQLPQVSCYLGHTSPKTHQLIRDNLHRSALYSGQITATGVRYCPSVEDKVVKFPEREQHHVFVEPEGLESEQVYPNGLSNSLPLEVQLEVIHSVPGLEEARILQPGYGIEHDYLDPTQLLPSLETKSIRGLFFAGQINGTTGYEEAAAQGLMAGINAARRVQKAEPIVLDRSQAYIGVLIDDLVTKGTQEPYRMFTSRVEYRLVVREDNADERLTPLGEALGLITPTDAAAFHAKEAAIQTELKRLAVTRLACSPALTQGLARFNMAAFEGTLSLEDLLRRPEIDYPFLAEIDPASGRIDRTVRDRVEVRLKYAGYIQRQEQELEQFKLWEGYRIPEDFEYTGLPGLSREIVEKLALIRPVTLGQAGRISGVTPAAVTVLLWKMKQGQRRSGSRPRTRKPA